jgi:hypothetical protein
MKKVTIAIAILLLAGLATAQTMIPLPSFGRTYSSSMTRGLFLQAPIDFTVVGLRVPDEKQHGKQNVCLYKHTSAPPAYSGTVPLTPLFSKFGEPSANIIPCSEKFTKGEWLIVLGACGDSTQLHNSYASTSCFQTNVLGAPTSLCRCGTQNNIITLTPPHPIWSEVAGNPSRVEVYVASATIAGSGTPNPGGTIKFTLSSPIDANLPYQVGTALGNGPIPIDTRQLGLSADGLLVMSVGALLPTVFKSYAGTLDAKGDATASLDIPNFPVLKGVKIYTAFVTVLGTAPSGVSSISNTFMFVIA